MISVQSLDIKQCKYFKQFRAKPMYAISYNNHNVTNVNFDIAKKNTFLHLDFSILLDAFWSTGFDSQKHFQLHQNHRTVQNKMTKSKINKIT